MKLLGLEFPAYAEGIVIKVEREVSLLWLFRLVDNYFSNMYDKDLLPREDFLAEFFCGNLTDEIVDELTNLV